MLAKESPLRISAAEHPSASASVSLIDCSRSTLMPVISSVMRLAQ
jgi:hypothetical protein